MARKKKRGTEAEQQGTEAQRDRGTELKQGEVESITETVQEFKDAPVVQKSLITMRNGKPTRVFFDEKGKESGSEVVNIK